MNNNNDRLKVLFASSEVYPLIKTGGLADVSFNLPKHLAEIGVDIRIVMPAYYDTLIKLRQENRDLLSVVSPLQEGIKEFSILETTLPQTTHPQSTQPQTTITVWLIETAEFSERPGNPYVDVNGTEWTDNAHRFSLFCDAVTAIARGIDELKWLPDIVHCNDWHTGLVPAQLSLYKPSPATLFTIHNIAYQGLFPHSTFVELGLDESLWRYDALEFHNQLSFIKGGLVFSDWVNTVSPHYAKELTTAKFGHGLDAILRHRQASFSGIINGIDLNEWNPRNDPHIKVHYSEKTLEQKKSNTIELQRAFKLEIKQETSLLGWVGRLTEQKGLDLLLTTLPELIKLPIQLILLGDGDKNYENALKKWADKYPEKIAIHIGYDEALAHRIIAGSHFFLMPSNFEPCGLTQMYSQHYGTIPIASKVGGLVDTIVNINVDTLANHSATGFLFDDDENGNLLSAVKSAIKLHQNPSVYRTVQSTAMGKNFSWQKSAQNYLEIYQRIADNRKVREAIPPPR